MRRLTLLVLVVLALGGCGAATGVEVRGNQGTGTTTSTIPGRTFTSTTECQDHTLPCAGPPITDATTTVPVLDPSKKDETEIDDAIQAWLAQHATTTTVVLPRTS